MAEPRTLPAVPALLVSSDKITGSHRGRDAYVYVRQSTPTQVVVHTESLERQYELRERALGLGWPVHQVVVGSSANPGLRDFAVLAAITGGPQAHPQVSLDVNPTSRQILADHELQSRGT